MEVGGGMLMDRVLEVRRRSLEVEDKFGEAIVMDYSWLYSVFIMLIV